MSIDVLSGAELDSLAATSVMGWHRIKGLDHTYWGTGEVDKAGTPQVRYFWFPTSDDAPKDTMAVLLKALGDGYEVSIRTMLGGFQAEVWGGERDGIDNMHVIIAPTLPLALVRAICKAYEVRRVSL